MKQINENTVIATGKEMNDSGLFPHIQPTDTQILLWIKWKWLLNNEKITFAPVADLFTKRQDNSTHKLSSEELFFKLPQNADGSFMFENFISKYIEIERI